MSRIRAWPRYLPSDLTVRRKDAALDGVYKLTALGSGGAWIPAFKMSDTPGKALNPGGKRMWRLYGPQGTATADCMSTGDEDLASMEEIALHAVDAEKSRVVSRPTLTGIEQLHAEIIRCGKKV